MDVHSEFEHNITDDIFLASRASSHPIHWLDRLPIGVTSFP
jgi:hypothetical protein